MADGPFCPADAPSAAADAADSAKKRRKCARILKKLLSRYLDDIQICKLE
jgi:hypothetical protein